MFIVIFEVHPADGKKDEYLAHAKDLKPGLESIEGFIDNERFESRRRPGWVLSLSTWRDEKAVIRWRTEARHHLVQEKGRAGIFSDYHLRVGEVTADDQPPDGIALRQQRFDATEAGSSKACSVIELTPEDGAGLPKDTDALLRAVRLDPGRPALVDHDVFDSIYVPGKALVLASWADAEGADGFHPSTVAGAASTRERKVRVIRDYGMFDRRETPQYYPEADRLGR